MRFSSLLSPAPGIPSRLLNLYLLLTTLAHTAGAISFNPIPSPNVDFSQLGRVGFAGDFDGISLYDFQGQNENGYNTNGSQSVLAPYPDGSFATLASSDGSITAMCPFVLMDGTMAGIIVAGNFTSLKGVESQGVALFNPNTSGVAPLTGLSGQVSALYCDKTSNTVYVGGSFQGANSTNAVAWVGTAGWTNLPFDGFNGPVTSITKAANGHIIFGGTFTGLGNASAPTKPDEQIINISGARSITAGSSTTAAGFSDPKNIVCKTNGADGSGNTWLLADNTAGYWQAQFDFGFTPTMLRLWNTRQDGKGTKTWRFTSLSDNGIMNLTYIDLATGQNVSCTSECPLSNNASVPYQDFHFVNVVGMDGFQIDISAWYGSAGGLDGIELFENDIFAHAINTFNEPSCANISIASKATTTGSWTVTPSGQSTSEYLTAFLQGPSIDSSSASIVFYPDVKQAGNYSVNIYTPGCLQDNSCSSRGRVNITVATTSAGGGMNTEIWQTNDFPKYDQIYFGYVDAASDSFRPTVTMSPSAGQGASLTIVAQRVGFALISSQAGGLNSLFEYDPSQAIVNTTDFSRSTFDKAGATLGNGAGVKALASTSSLTYVAGNFTTSQYGNIFAVSNSSAEALAGGGLNSYIMTLYLNGTILYVGGNFTGTSNSSTDGLNNVAAYDTSKNTWIPLGAGVNGRVFSIVPLPLNITAGNPEDVIAITGNFDQTLGFGVSPASSVSGFAIWVPSHGNWLSNLNISTVFLNGQLSARVDYPGGGSLFAGSLSSNVLGVNGLASISSGLASLPVTIQPSNQQSSSNLGKRASASQNVTGVTTGLYYVTDNRNITVIGGHFTALASNGSTINNLLFINGSNSNTVTGAGTQLTNDSTVLAMAVQNDTLYAGGFLSGTVNGNGISGIISFDFKTATFGAQPPGLVGDEVAVYSVTARPNNGDVYVGGAFSKTDSLDCPGVCVFSTSAAEWNRPGSNFAGTAHAMLWTGPNTLVVGGDVSVGGGSTYMATYDAQALTWTTFNGASAIPGPVTALTPASSDNSQIWVAGSASNGSTFLMKYDGSSWNSAGDTLGAGTVIQGLQVFSLSQDHDSTDLVPSSQTLMLTGSLNVPGFGNASAVLFNGTTFQPYALTSSLNGAGSISQIFFQEQNAFATPGSHLALGFVVLISLAISLALIFLIVVGGIIAERLRRKRDGYMPAPTNMYDKASQMTRLPPEQLFGTVSHGRNGGAPVI